MEIWSYLNSGLNKTASVESLKVLLLCWPQTQPAPPAPSTVVMILSHIPDPDLHVLQLAFHLGRKRQAVALNSCQKDCTNNLVGVVKKKIIVFSVSITFHIIQLDWQIFWNARMEDNTDDRVHFHLRTVESHDFSMLRGILSLRFIFTFCQHSVPQST